MSNQLEYTLHENKLKGDPDSFYAKVSNTGTATIDDLIDEATGSGSTLTRAEAYAFLEEFNRAELKFLKAGYRINTEMYNISHSISGIFNNRKDKYDAIRHSVNINVSPGTKLKSIESEFSPTVIEYTQELPVIDMVKDITSQTANEKLTPGGVADITGHRLSFDNNDPNQGVFLVSIDGLTYRASVFIRLKPSELIFTIPEEAKPGTYFIEVRAIFNGNKNIRTGRTTKQLAI
jgi:hypothetical protein